MPRAVFCLLLVAVLAVAVHPPIVAACCLVVDRAGCCGPSSECCRVVQAQDTVAGPTGRLYDPGHGPGLPVPLILGAPSFAAADAPAFFLHRDDRPPPDSTGVRLHLRLVVVRV